jgi:long-chain acyl-CoA synthetase
MTPITPKFVTIRAMVEERARAIPEKPYIYFGDRTVTFADFDRRSNRVANALLTLGVRAGDVVHVYMNNSPELMMAVVACNKIGAIAGPVNCWWQASEVEYLLNDSKARALIVEDAYGYNVEQVRARCPHLSILVQKDGETRPGYVDFETIVGAAADVFTGPPTDPEAAAYLFYTAGTTGNSKGALLRESGILACIEGITQALTPPSGSEDENALFFLPLFHVNAMMSMLSMIYRGNSAALMPMFSVSDFGPMVEKYRVAYFSAVPTIYSYLLQAKEVVMQSDLSSLKYGICGAAPMPVKLFQDFEATYGFKIIEGYGLTEGTVASTINPREGVRKIGSIGKAIPGQVVEIVDEGGNVLPQGQRGEICVRGRNVMIGYLGKPDETKETIGDGRLHTGDVGYEDEDGYFFIVDRLKDMYIRGGENVYPKEIENVLYRHPKVRDAAVIGVPDEKRGEEGKAFVVLKPGETATPEELAAWCKTHLAEFKVPKHWAFRDDLPKSIIGKILKKELRREERG